MRRLLGGAILLVWELSGSYMYHFGLMSYLLGSNKKQLAGDTNFLGPLLENFVVMELRKQIGWSEIQARLFHFRTQTGQEVDIILENPAGKLVGIEVKAAATLGTHDFKGLRVLAELTKNRFHRGVVLYTGTQSIPFGPRFHALPVGALWSMGAVKN